MQPEEDHNSFEGNLHLAPHCGSVLRVASHLQVATEVPLDKALTKLATTSPGKRLPYAIIRGTVTPIGKPMSSVMSPSVSAVIQVMKLEEHRVSKGMAGFWMEDTKMLRTAANDIPFCIKSPDASVEILDALSAKILDLDVVYDNYEPAQLSLFDYIFGFISGVTQRGYQTTEEVLREGSFITAIGEIESTDTGLKLQPSKIGPMFLTTATKGTLLRRFEQAKASAGFRIFLFGSVAVVLVGLIGRKIYMKKKQERSERLFREQMDQSRQERRSRQRPANVPNEQRCVVCVDHPREVICLPCGHVCLCEDCAIRIHTSCPVCQTRIEMKSPAFFA